MPLFDPLTALADAENRSLLSYVWLCATVLAWIVGALQLLAAVVNRENFVSGLNEGTRNTYNKWEAVSGREEAALASAMRAHRATGAQKGREREVQVERLLQAIEQIVYAVYNHPPNSVTVTFATPNETRTCLIIRNIANESGGRQSGSEYILPTDQRRAHSMMESFLKGQLVYTPETHAFEDMRSKDYHSIMNLPVHDDQRRVLAVVNIDARPPEYFGPVNNKDSRQQVFQLSLPILKQLGIMLM